MGERTDIPWTDSTLNFWRGCSGPVSPGCAHCYARRLVERWGKSFRSIMRLEKAYTAPLHWKKPKHIFVESIGDFFDPEVPPSWRFDAWKVIKACPQHVFQIPTKRPELIRGMLPPDWGEGYPNVWLGVSVEDQARADVRIPELLNVPAAIHWVSCEPLLGPIDLSKWLVCVNPADKEDHLHFPRLDWVVVGGESGPGFRPMNLDWARVIRDWCVIYHVPFYFKQIAATRPNTGAVLGGEEWRQTP